MEIRFELFKGQSGLNVWTERLSRTIQSSEISTSIFYHPFYHQFFRVGFKVGDHHSIPVLQHANSWNGWSFRSEHPLVVTEHTAIHETYLNKYKTIPQSVYHRIIKRYENKSIHCANQVTCVSKFAKTCLEKTFNFSDAELIYNGIDTSVFRQESNPDENSFFVEKEKTVILFVGNLTLLKGADLLPQIMDILGNDFVLLVTSGFRSNVSIQHPGIIKIGTLDQEELVKAYNTCDIFLTTSRLEGFGLSVAEAMACEKPVVATNGSSLPELVINDKSGFLCEMNDVKDFADKIQYLSENPGEMKRMGAFNRERVRENFENAIMTRRYINLYRSL
jgi:glycosyltransferase involved in cell wall biosynthesis